MKVFTLGRKKSRSFDKRQKSQDVETTVLYTESDSTGMEVSFDDSQATEQQPVPNRPKRSGSLRNLFQSMPRSSKNKMRVDSSAMKVEEVYATTCPTAKCTPIADATENSIFGFSPEYKKCARVDEVDPVPTQCFRQQEESPISDEIEESCSDACNDAVSAMSTSSNWGSSGFNQGKVNMERENGRDAEVHRHNPDRTALSTSTETEQDKMTESFHHAGRLQQAEFGTSTTKSIVMESVGGDQQVDSVASEVAVASEDAFPDNDSLTTWFTEDTSCASIATSSNAVASDNVSFGYESISTRKSFVSRFTEDTSLFGSIAASNNKASSTAVVGFNASVGDDSISTITRATHGSQLSGIMSAFATQRNFMTRLTEDTLIGSVASSGIAVSNTAAPDIASFGDDSISTITQTTRHSQFSRTTSKNAAPGNDSVSTRKTRSTRGSQLSDSTSGIAHLDNDSISTRKTRTTRGSQLSVATGTSWPSFASIGDETKSTKKSATSRTTKGSRRSGTTSAFSSLGNKTLSEQSTTKTRTTSDLVESQRHHCRKRHSKRRHKSREFKESRGSLQQRQSKRRSTSETSDDSKEPRRGRHKRRQSKYRTLTSDSEVFQRREQQRPSKRRSEESDASEESQRRRRQKPSKRRPKSSESVESRCHRPPKHRRKTSDVSEESQRRRPSKRRSSKTSNHLEQSQRRQSKRWTRQESTNKQDPSNLLVEVFEDLRLLAEGVVTGEDDEGSYESCFCAT